MPLETFLNDLTFHDLRHEAISRMFDTGMRIPEAMVVTGHQTVNHLFRYVQPQSDKASKANKWGK